MNARVLIATGDPSLGQHLSAALRRSGLEVLIAASTQEAIPLVARQPPQAVLVDLPLPGGNETHLLVGLSQLKVPAVGVGNTTMDFDAVRALIARGALADFYTKPVDMAAVAARVVELATKAPLSPERAPRPLLDPGLLGDLNESTLLPPPAPPALIEPTAVARHPSLEIQIDVVDFDIDEPEPSTTLPSAGVSLPPPVGAGEFADSGTAPRALASELQPEESRTEVPPEPTRVGAPDLQAASQAEAPHESTRVVAFMRKEVSQRMLIWSALVILAVIALAAYPVFRDADESPATVKHQVAVSPPDKPESEVEPPPLDEAKLRPSGEDRRGEDFSRQHPPESEQGTHANDVSPGE